MQAEPVVALAPGGARLRARLEDDRRETLPPEERGRGEAGRACADDRDVERLHLPGSYHRPQPRARLDRFYGMRVHQQHDGTRAGLMRPAKPKPARPERDEVALANGERAPLPQPERRERSVPDPRLRDLTFADW